MRLSEPGDRGRRLLALPPTQFRIHVVPVWIRPTSLICRSCGAHMNPHKCVFMSTDLFAVQLRGARAGWRGTDCHLRGSGEDAPAWQVSRMHAIADLRGWSPFVALSSTQAEPRLGIANAQRRDLCSGLASSSGALCGTLVTATLTAILFLAYALAGPISSIEPSIIDRQLV